jgi:hypothetical protein
MKSDNSQNLWIELTETQTEAINGGLIAFNFAIASKLTYQDNGALVLASGNAIGIGNRAGVFVVQTNIA